MPGFGDALGKSGEAAWQLFVWQIMGSVVGAALAPFLTELTYLVNDAVPDLVLPSGDLTEAVLRGHMTLGAAQADARKQGIDSSRFAVLLENATPRIAPADLAQLLVRHFIDRGAANAEAALQGVPADKLALLELIAADAPGPDALAVAARRGLIAEDGTGPGVVSFLQGISESRLGDKWAPMIRGLAIEQPSPTDILQAYLEGQIEEPEARERFVKLGGDPDYFTILYNTRGTAPSPVELGVLARRGIIEWEGTGPAATSFRQGILEGPSRNKWIPAWRALSDYVPPPRTVTAMLRNHSYTVQQAAVKFAENGLRPDDVTAYIADATAQRQARSRDLTEAQLTQVYQDQLIGADVYLASLEALGFDRHEAGLLQAMADLRWQISALTTATARIHTLYVGWKIDRATAATALSDLGTPGERAQELIGIWGIERQANTKDLTAAEIWQLLKLQVIDEADALRRLEQIGYTPGDAWLYLASHGAVLTAAQPPAGPAALQ